MESSDGLKEIANFLFEAGMLQKTPRSGFAFLGTGEQSVAEHLNRTAYIGFALAQMKGKADTAKVMEMCLFHDFCEARVSDLNYTHQRYVDRHEERAVEALTEHLPFGGRIRETISEYEKRESLEAVITKEADNLELLLSLKEQADLGNPKALSWIPPLVLRLRTEEGKALAQAIMEVHMDDWWYPNKDDAWFVNRGQQHAP